MTDARERRRGAGRSTRRGVLRRAGVAATAGLAGCADLWRGGTYDRTQEGFDPPVLPPEEPYPDDDDVTMFRRGLRRLGYYPDETVPDAVSVNWELPVNYIGHNAAKASPLPTPDGETVLIPADTGHVHAVTPAGRHRWTALTGATSLGIHATPAVAHGVAYVGGYDGDLYAFDVETGERVWRTGGLDGATALGSSPAYWDGIVYVVAEYLDPKSGTMWAVDAETGEALWSDDRLWGMPHPTTAIHPVAERMVTGSNDGVLYCWEFPSLEFAWDFRTGAEIKCPIATYDGSAIFGSWDGYFYSVALADGAGEWSFETGAVNMSAPAIDPDLGLAYLGSDDWNVYALDVETGEEVWSTNVGGRVIGALTVTAETVLVGSYDAHLYALDKETGRRRWRVANRGQVTSAPVPRDGRIYYAERAVVSGYWDDDREEVTEVPGHAYCLVADD